MQLSDLIHQYEQQQRGRALGGLRALSGFDFQLRCHLADFVEHLVSCNGVLQNGQNFAQGLEALSDFTTGTPSGLVCVQAKRTLTTTVIAQAAVEFATIADFLQSSPNAETAAIRPRFRVVGNRSELADDWSWDAVTLPAKEVSKRLELQRIWQSLVDGQRLDPPEVEADPWWRVIAATFHRLDRPFEFARQALDLCLRRHESSAERVRDDIAERFRQHLSQTPLKNFQAVTESDFAPDPDDRLQPLRVGYRPSLALVRNRQFLTRDVHIRNAINSLDALLLHQDYGNVTGLPVLWISGPSGCGKSVVLLQVMESVVKSGLSVVWLEDDARRVVPLLRTFCAEREADSTDLPGFIFIDDLYSPTNQQRIDLAELETVVGTRPFDRWPVIVTCGPPEFYDRLERESSGGTLHLERWSLPLVEIQPPTTGGPAEADLFTAWYQERTGEQPQRGSAFDRDRGLMISMAYELRFEAPRALKPFASRFRDRLKADDLDQKLVLPLALNRLYLLAPAEWLDEPDRERFEAINRENDFSILDLGGDGEFLRLTHPHISDGIYRAIREPATPRAFANDLAEAMRRAMASNVTTVRLLLRAFSSADPRIAERLEDVDLERLAELVTADWKQSDVETRLHGSELADVSTSWACWHARKPELRLEERLGHPLLAAARTALRNAGPAWTSNWQPLRAAYADELDLLADAVEWLHEPASERSQGWSFVWEEVWNQRGLSGLPFDERTLVLSARGWLERQWDQEDWHFVWTKLVNQLPSEPSDSDLAGVVELGWQWLTHKPSFTRRGVVPHDNLAAWAYVWQDLLKQQRFTSDPARSDLLKLGVAWLEGREDRSEWAHVWQRLLESLSLPPGITRDELLRLGREWLVQPTHRPRPEWDKLLESWIDAGGDDGELLRAAADWIMQHRDEKQVPPFAAKVLRAAREPAAFDHIAQWLTEWGRAHPNPGQSKFVIGFLRTEQGKGWTPASDSPGWKTLLDWLALRSPPIHRADDASAALLQQMQAAGQRVFGRITQRLPRGFLVALCQPEIAAFLPGSQVDLHAPTDWDAFVGLESEFEIQSVSLGETGWHVIVSRRPVLEAEKAARAEARLRELHAGDHVVGTVKQLVDYGAFIDLDGLDGLLHLNEMAWHRPTSPADYCVVGQPLELVVLSIDAPKRQVALGLKQLTPNPWDAIGPTLVVGLDIDGIVTKLVDFAAFIEVAPGVTGLLHMSNLSWAKRTRHPEECLQIGQQLRCRILRVDVVNRKLQLGLKQLAANPWEERIPRQYRAGAWVDGRVTNLTNFGLFVELEPDLEGLLRLTEIPEAPADPKELLQHFSIGQTLRIRILRLDAVEQKIALSLKPSDT